MGAPHSGLNKATRQMRSKVFDAIFCEACDLYLARLFHQSDSFIFTSQFNTKRRTVYEKGSLDIVFSMTGKISSSF